MEDEETWAARVVGHVDALVRFARAFTPDAAEAEDLVQETLVRALRARAQLRAGSSELAWLRSILRNLAIDRARRPIREVPMDEVDACWHDDRYTVDVAEVVAAAQERDELLDALSRLSHTYRTMVVLHDIEGWTVAEAAEALDIELPAAKQRLRRGRMALVTALADQASRRVDLAGVPLRCWDARRHVSDFVDDALEPGMRAAVEAHVAGCPTCPALVASLVGATSALGQARDPDGVVAPELAERIRHRLRGAEPGES